MINRCGHKARAQAQRGMTLIEVLVAFAILSGIAMSVLILVGQNAQYMLNTEERLLASIAADNLLIEELSRRATPSAGQDEGAVDVAERSFLYTRTTTEIGENAVLIEFVVSRGDGAQSLSRVSALKEKS